MSGDRTVMLMPGTLDKPEADSEHNGFYRTRGADVYGP